MAPNEDVSSHGRVLLRHEAGRPYVQASGHLLLPALSGVSVAGTTGMPEFRLLSKNDGARA